ncbi:MAG: alpha-hydroxy-acid oxidizing protein [Phenylobacterium sp.]|uniref:alpha-hydroxy acid oxidase n=1 Tax=Phenylobacterium sp. TaxID=1871053 RepID=UPI00391A962E
MRSRPGAPPACLRVVNGPGPAPVEAGRIPAEVRCALDYERLAEQALPPEVFAHLAGGSGEELTLRRSRAAFEAVAITPRMLRRVDGGHTQVSLPDRVRPHPILLAPLAHQKLYHPRGEIETARGAGATETGFVVSTLSSCSLEQIAAAAGPDRWFQLYVQPEPRATLDLARRAKAAGYAALVVTVDTPLQAPSLRALQAGFRPEACESANLAPYRRPPTPAGGQSRILQGLMAQAPDWDEVERLIAAVGLPVWIKGVMHPDDAAEAFRRGAAGVIVSNHGGRALDGAPASLEALPRIRAAVGEGAGVLFDGGIRSGADIFKALALGADAVLVGRPQAYALAVAGALGVGHMIKLLREELELCMALAGCATLADIRAAEILSDGARSC